MRYTENLNPKKISIWATIMASLNPVEIVTAKNAAAEKEAWLERDGFSTPNLQYDEDKLRSIVSSQDELRRAEAAFASGVIPESNADKFVKSILMSRISGAIDATEIAAGILLGNDSRTGAIAKKIYGLPPLANILEAYETAKNPSTEENPGMFTDIKAHLKDKEFGAEQIKYWFGEALKLLEIDNWPILISDEFTAIDVRDKSTAGSIVGIPTSRKVSGLKLTELIGHEILCHLRSSENTRAALRDIIGENSILMPLLPVLAKSDDESLYEGVAKVSDVSVNGSSSAPAPWFMIATDLACRGKGFSEIAEEIFDLRIANGAKPDVARKAAYTTAYRILRGSTHPESGEYVFPKDQAYLTGYKQVQRVGSRLRDFSTLSFAEATELCENYGAAPRYSSEHVLDIISKGLLF